MRVQVGVPAAGLVPDDGEPMREEVEDERGDPDDVEYAEVRGRGPTLLNVRSYFGVLRRMTMD